jgi:hypothetical protein
MQTQDKPGDPMTDIRLPPRFVIPSTAQAQLHKQTLARSQTKRVTKVDAGHATTTISKETTHTANSQDTLVPSFIQRQIQAFLKVQAEEKMLEDVTEEQMNREKEDNERYAPSPKSSG